MTADMRRPFERESAGNVIGRRIAVWNFAPYVIFWRQPVRRISPGPRELLHVTQPTLSRQLMDLERELGTTLMYRGKKGMTLTEDGLFFRQRAEEIVELADRLEQSFVERSTEVSGVISIGATESVGSRLFAKLIKQFSDKYPLVKFDLYNEMADYIKERMDKGLIDVGLLLEPVDTSRYQILRLPVRESWGVLVPEDSPLARREAVTPGDLADSPLILTTRELMRREMIRWFGLTQTGSRWRPAATCLTTRPSWPGRGWGSIW